MLILSNENFHRSKNPPSQTTDSEWHDMKDFIKQKTFATSRVWHARCTWMFSRRNWVCEWRKLNSKGDSERGATPNEIHFGGSLNLQSATIRYRRKICWSVVKKGVDKWGCLLMTVVEQTANNDSNCANNFYFTAAQIDSRNFSRCSTRLSSPFEISQRSLPSTKQTPENTPTASFHATSTYRISHET